MPMCSTVSFVFDTDDFLKTNIWGIFEKNYFKTVLNNVPNPDLKRLDGCLCHLVFQIASIV